MIIDIRMSDGLLIYMENNSSSKTHLSVHLQQHFLKEMLPQSKKLVVESF